MPDEDMSESEQRAQQDILAEMVAAFRAAYPQTAAMMFGPAGELFPADDNHPLRQALASLARELEAERDVEVLSYIVGWFADEATPAQLAAFFVDLERREGDGET